MAVLNRDNLMEAIRKINALVGDYLAHDFPLSIEEMTVEFAEVAEEIQAITHPIVESEDE